MHSFVFVVSKSIPEVPPSTNRNLSPDKRCNQGYKARILIALGCARHAQRYLTLHCLHCAECRATLTRPSAPSLTVPVRLLSSWKIRSCNQSLLGFGSAKLKIERENTSLGKENTENICWQTISFPEHIYWWIHAKFSTWILFSFFISNHYNPVDSIFY